MCARIRHPPTAVFRATRQKNDRARMVRLRKPMDRQLSDRGGRHPRAHSLSQPTFSRISAQIGRQALLSSCLSKHGEPAARERRPPIRPVEAALGAAATRIMDGTAARERRPPQTNALPREHYRFHDIVDFQTSSGIDVCNEMMEHRYAFAFELHTRRRSR